MQKVSYGERTVTYRTFDKKATEVLRLNFMPARVTAGGTVLSERKDLKAEGHTVQPLPSGDYVVRLRHLQSGEVGITEK